MRWCWSRAAPWTRPGPSSTVAGCAEPNWLAPACCCRSKVGRRPKLAESWDQWVYAAFGQMLESNTEFHSMYRMDLDGFLHTYQGTGSAFETMSLSTDQEFNKKLMDTGASDAADSAITRMSQASARFMPAPTAMPLTAAIVGNGLSATSMKAR